MYEFELEYLTLAQGEPLTSPPPDAGAAPPAPGAGDPLTGAPAGPPGSGQGSKPDPFGGLFFPIIFMVIMMIFMFTMFGQRRDKKKRESMLGTVKKHDRVQTIGGVIGSVVEVKADNVVLKVDESSNTRITFARSAIQQVLTASDGDKPDS
jgi:preprotein translocase subunit YajC